MTRRRRLDAMGQARKGHAWVGLGGKARRGRQGTVCRGVAGQGEARQDWRRGNSRGSAWQASLGEHGHGQDGMAGIAGLRRVYSVPVASKGSGSRLQHKTPRSPLIQAAGFWKSSAAWTPPGLAQERQPGGDLG